MQSRFEIFVATRGGALHFGKRLDPATSPARDRSALGGLPPIALEMLWAILLHEPFDPARHELENLYFGSRRRGALARMRRKLLILKAVAKALLGRGMPSSGLYRIPLPLARALASLDDARLVTVASAWAHTEPMTDRRAEASDLLRELRRLALHAQASRRRIFVWGTSIATEAA